MEVNSRDIFLSAFFDDSGLGTNSQEEHLMLIEKFFQTCLENNVRVKLSKCDFMVEELDYLGFHIGFGKWSSSPT